MKLQILTNIDRELNKIVNITYKPWIGKNYGNSELGKLLIIGDSHYFNYGLPNNLSDFTVEKIKELRIISANFYDKVDAILNQGGKHDIWDKIAFANAVQTPFSSADQKPTKDDLDTAKIAFREYLDMTKPEKVIVFSSRVWEHCFNDEVNIWGKHLEKIDNRWNIRELEYTGGTCKAIGLHHPSTPGFDKSKFQKVVSGFLNDY